MSGRKVTVVDYGAGNLKSVENALTFLGADFRVTARPEEIITAEMLVFPGVGEARAAMDVLSSTGMAEAMREYVRTGKPLLGICIGCQIALGFSEERSTTCLGLVPGTVRLFPPTPGLKVPHMGWNQVAYREDEPLFRDIPQEASFYFVHSYYPDPASADAVAAWTEYGIRFASAIRLGNLHAVQFHPEKSGRHGLKLIGNFLAFRE